MGGPRRWGGPWSTAPLSLHRHSLVRCPCCLTFQEFGGSSLSRRLCTGLRAGRAHRHGAARSTLAPFFSFCAPPRQTAHPLLLLHRFRTGIPVIFTVNNASVSPPTPRWSPAKPSRRAHWWISFCRPPSVLPSTASPSPETLSHRVAGARPHVSSGDRRNHFGRGIESAIR